MGQIKNIKLHIVTDIKRESKHNKAMAAASGGFGSDSDNDDFAAHHKNNDNQNNDSDDDDDVGLDDKPSDIKRAANECKIVFKDFLYRRLASRHGLEDESDVNDVIPHLDAPLDTCPGMDETERQQFRQVGNALAMFGDEIEHKYRTRFQQLLVNFNLEDTSSDFCFDKFRLVALRLLRQGEAGVSMNWYRIVALLCFGYEMAIMYIRRRSSDVARFLKKIVTWVVRLMVNERIIEWIVSQGGWVAGFIERLGDVRQNSTELWLKRVGALALITALCFSGFRFFNGGKS